MKTLAQIVVLLTSIAFARAQGAFEGLTDYSTGPSSGSFAVTAGWSFTPQISIEVTHLGCLDYVVTPQGPVDVGLWTSAGQLIASAIVDATNKLTDVSRYVALGTAVFLNAGTSYRLGVWSSSGLFLDPVGPGVGGSATVSSDIALGNAVVASGNGFVFPDQQAGPAGTMLLGPNFRFDRVPEPATGSLLFLGASLFLARRRLFKR